MTMNGLSARSLIPALLLSALLATPGPGDGTARAQNAPYVGAWEADHEFPTITAEQMDVLRTKKILFASRSFGLNMYNGLASLKAKNPMHDLISSYVRYDVFNAGGDLSIIPADVYNTYHFVHFLATYWPHSVRVTEVDTLIRNAPHSFWEDIDVALIYFHYAESSIYDTYAARMDALRADFPHIQFIYVGAGYMDTNHAAQNQQSVLFNERARADYRGKVPFYDLAAILSDDGRCGAAYCPEYSTDPAGVHPNTPFAQERMAKGFLVVLRDIFFGSSCTSAVPPTVPGNLSGSALSSTSLGLGWSPSTHADCGIERYDVSRDGATVAETHATNIVLTGLMEGTMYTCAVRAVSLANVPSAWTAPLALATLGDTTPPTIVRAHDTRSATSVTVDFSEPLEEASAETAANYTLAPAGTVVAATLAGQTVTLTTAGLLGGATHTLTVNGVRDASAARNTIAPGSQATFRFIDEPYPGNPVAWWRFEGSPADATTNVLSGTWVGSPSYGQGLLGQGLALNGATNGPYVSVAHRPLLDGMAAMTLSAWARKTAAGVGGQLVKKHVIYSLAIGANSISSYVYVGSTTGDAVNVNPTVASINDTAWHHYALVFDGTNSIVYADGVERGRGAKTGRVWSRSASPVYVGKNPFNDAKCFAGALDEVKLFARALRPDEVAALAAAGAAGSADEAAVRALLDANGLTQRLVSGCSVVESDRIVNLYLQESGVHTLTPHIGALDDLRLLHVYGDRALGHPLLRNIAPEIGRCTKLGELLLNQNELSALPAAITNLADLAILSLGENRICNPDPAVAAWADANDPDWRATQDCPEVNPGTTLRIGREAPRTLAHPLARADRRPAAMLPRNPPAGAESALTRKPHPAIWSDTRKELP